MKMQIKEFKQEMLNIINTSRKKLAVIHKQRMCEEMMNVLRNTEGNNRTYIDTEISMDTIYNIVNSLEFIDCEHELQKNGMFCDRGHLYIAHKYIFKKYIKQAFFAIYLAFSICKKYSYQYVDGLSFINFVYQKNIYNILTTSHENNILISKAMSIDEADMEYYVKHNIDSCYSSRYQTFGKNTLDYVKRIADYGFYNMSKEQYKFHLNEIKNQNKKYINCYEVISDDDNTAIVCVLLSLYIGGYYNRTIPKSILRKPQLYVFRYFKDSMSYHSIVFKERVNQVMLDNRDAVTSASLKEFFKVFGDGYYDYEQ